MLRYLVTVIYLASCYLTSYSGTVDFSFGSPSPNYHHFDAFCPSNHIITQLDFFTYQDNATYYVPGVVVFCDMLDGNGVRYTSITYSYQIPPADDDGISPPTWTSLPRVNSQTQPITSVSVYIVPQGGGTFISNIEIEGTTVNPGLINGDFTTVNYKNCPLVGVRGSYDSIALTSLVFAFQECDNKPNLGRSENWLYGQVLGLPFPGQMGRTFACNPNQYLVSIEGPKGTRVTGLKFKCSDGVESQIFGQPFSETSNPAPSRPHGIYHVAVNVHMNENRLIYLTYAEGYGVGNDGTINNEFNNLAGGTEPNFFAADESGKVVTPFDDETANFGCKSVGVVVFTDGSYINGIQLIYDCSVTSNTIILTPLPQQIKMVAQISKVIMQYDSGVLQQEAIANLLYHGGFRVLNQVP